MRHDGIAYDRWNLLHPDEPLRTPYVTAQLQGEDGPFVACSDFIRAYPDLIRNWVPGRYTVSGWPDDYLVWSRDPKGTVVSRTKTVGSSFFVAVGARSFVLYSYDKNRGEGLVAGPFPVQDNAKPADR